MSRDSLSATRTVRVRNAAMLALILTLAGSCDNPTKPPTQPSPATGTVRFGVTFATTPLALASIVVTLTSSGLPTVTIDLTPISGTDSRQWTGGPVTVTAATYAVDIQGKDASGVVTYRGSGSITVGANQSRTFAFALVCVSSQCQPASGTVSVFVLAPELETEPNDVPSTATPLEVVSLLDGQLQMWAVNGAIDPAGDVDYFSLPFSPVFSPGDTIVVQVYGQRFGSTVDAAATLFDPFGNVLAQADNVEGADPVIKIPAFVSFVAGPIQVRVSGVGGSTGRYTMWAYACRSGGTHSVSCFDPSWAPALVVGTASIVGEVRDAVTFNLISGATVRLGPAGGLFDRQVTTGPDGSFVFGGLAGGAYQAEATAPGYIANTAANVQIVNVAGADVARADFALPPLSSTQRFSSLSGRVTTVGGAPLAGANVTISGGAQTNGVFRAAITETDGTYALTGIVLDDVNGTPITSFTVEASFPLYSAQSKTLTLIQNQTVTNVDFQLTLAPPAAVFFSDCFESVTPWEATGFWNRSTLSSIVNAAYPTYVNLAPDDNSGAHLPVPVCGSFAFWYGDPATGNFLGTQSPGDPPLSGGTSTSPNSGTLTSPAFTIPASAAAATLRFDTWFEIESQNPNASGFDIMSMAVEDMATGAITELGRLNPFEDPTFPDRHATPFSSAGFNRAPVWRPVFVNLNAFRGKAIRLEFTFDTVDELYNGFRGWVIDNLQVSDQAISGATAALPRLAPVAAPATPHTRRP